MRDLLIALVWTSVSYLIGCFAFAYYLHRWRTGRDIRGEGSGNAGARNAGRVLGRGAFLLVLAVDAGKGALAVGVASLLSLPIPLPELALVAVVAGHNFPVQLHFRGGRGNAAALGGTFVLDPLLALVSSLLAAALLVATGRGALAGALAVVLAPLTAVVLARGVPVIAAMLALSALSIAAHHTELRAFAGRSRG